MIGVDTNVLVYAHRRDSPFHDKARDAVSALAESGAPWSIPWPCVNEFLGIMTHPGIYRPASTPEQALDQIDAWRESPDLILLSEADGYWSVLRELVIAGGITGARVHDARVAALCIHHGVTELWTADRDFGRFPRLRTVNPLVL